jgi:hypothetical protein
MDGAGETGRNLPEAAPGSLGLNAVNLRTVRHLGGAHDDADQISSRAAWWDASGVNSLVTLFKCGKAPTPGVPRPARNNPAAKVLRAGSGRYHVKIFSDVRFLSLRRIFFTSENKFTSSCLACCDFLAGPVPLYNPGHEASLLRVTVQPLIRNDG